jgi:endonuclease/exonuclease/phosphatase family metal-dependent hydrolase
MHPARVVSLLSLALVLALGVGVPSASAKPAQVGLVSITGASTTSLTLTWPKVSGATYYEIFRSLHENMSYSSIVKKSTHASATITGLTPGRTYCFQVRGRAGKTVGARSAHTCKPTIRAMGTVNGTAYNVMTFNACSDNCSNWPARHQAALDAVRTRAPDVLATQEADEWTTPPPGYAEAAYMHAKRLFYKTSRFSVAPNSQGPTSGYVQMSSARYAVWAELVDRATDKHIIFVDAHTSYALADYQLRGQEVQTLIDRMNQINTNGLPIVYAGDYNSNKHRGTYDEKTGFGSQDTVGRTFAANGYYDSYDLARTTHRPNWNSYSGLTTTPTIGKTWGDHVDHVYVKPASVLVYRWMNAGLYSGSRYVSPVPSDHRPVQVTLYID